MTELTMKHWVNGQEVVEDGADVIAIDSPTTGEVLGGVAEASIELIERAIQGARKAQQEWAAMSLATSATSWWSARMSSPPSS